MIRHQLIKDFAYKEAILEFVEIEGVKSRENIGRIVLELLYKLNIKCKLLLITRDNTLNNKTLIDEVKVSLYKQFLSISDVSNTSQFYS